MKQLIIAILALISINSYSQNIKYNTRGNLVPNGSNKVVDSTEYVRGLPDSLAAGRAYTSSLIARLDSAYTSITNSGDSTMLILHSRLRNDTIATLVGGTSGGTITGGSKLPLVLSDSSIRYYGLNPSTGLQDSIEFVAKRDTIVNSLSNYFDNGKTYDGLAAPYKTKVTRIGNVLYGLVDDFTGEPVTFTKVTNTTGIVIDSVMYCSRDGEVFKRNYTGRVNVRWYGAIGDGVTNNTKAMQAAMDFLSRDGGGVMYIPYSSKTYKLDSLLLKFTVSIEGDGGETSLEATTSTASGLMIMDASPITGVHYSSFRLIGNPANTGQHGWDMTATGKYNTYKTGGIWYSTWTDITVIYFPGHGFHFVALDDQDAYANNDIANQFLFFNNVNVFAPNGADTRALYAEGQFGQVVFNGGEFDGTNNHNTAGSIAIELLSELYSSNGTDHVYSVTFNGTTVQSSDIGIKSYYASLAILNCHFERLRRQVYATGTSRVRIDNTAFSSPSTVYTGTQYLLRNESSYVDFTNNMCSGGNIVAVNGYATNIKDIRYPDGNNPVIVTTGCTIQAGVRSDSSINVYGNKSFLVNTSATPIKRLNSQQAGNDAEISLMAFGGPIQIRPAVDGNISIPPHFGSKIDLKAGEMVTFGYMDLGVRTWFVKSVSATPFIDTTSTYYTRNQDDALLIRKVNKRDITIQMSLTAGTDTLSTGSTSDVLLNLNNDTLRNIASNLTVGDNIRLIGVNGLGRQTVIMSGGNITTTGYEDGTGTIILRVGEIVTFTRENLLSVWQVTSAKTAKYSGIIPTIGTYYQGEIIHNKNYNGTNNRSWICTATGAPGTWVASDQIKVDTATNTQSTATIGQLQKRIDSLQAMLVHLVGTETISGLKGAGYRLFNTTDTTTNYERFGIESSVTPNVYQIGSYNGGTGITRPIRIGIAGAANNNSLGRYFEINGASAPSLFNFYNSTGSAVTLMAANMTSTAATSNANNFVSYLNCNQSGSAGYIALGSIVYEQTTGSGSKYLVYAGTSTATNGGGTITPRFSVTSAGVATVSGALTAAGLTSTTTLTAASASVINWASRSSISSATDGSVLFRNNAGTAFSSLQFGGTSSLFPGLFVNSTGLDAKLADNSGYAVVQSLYDRVGAGSPEGVVAAPVGAHYHNTTGSTGTSFYVKETGTSGNTGWVAK